MQFKTLSFLLAVLVSASLWGKDIDELKPDKLANLYRDGELPTVEKIFGTAKFEAYAGRCFPDKKDPINASLILGYDQSGLRFFFNTEPAHPANYFDYKAYSNPPTIAGYLGFSGIVPTQNAESAWSVGIPNIRKDLFLKTSHSYLVGKRTSSDLKDMYCAFTYKRLVPHDGFEYRDQTFYDSPERRRPFDLDFLFNGKKFVGVPLRCYERRNFETPKNGLLVGIKRANGERAIFVLQQPGSADNYFDNFSVTPEWLSKITWQDEIVAARGNESPNSRSSSSFYYSRWPNKKMEFRVARLRAEVPNTTEDNSYFSVRLVGERENTNWVCESTVYMMSFSGYATWQTATAAGYPDLVPAGQTTAPSHSYRTSNNFETWGAPRVGPPVNVPNGGRYTSPAGTPRLDFRPW